MPLNRHEHPAGPSEEVDLLVVIYSFDDLLVAPEPGRDRLVPVPLLVGFRPLHHHREGQIGAPGDLDGELRPLLRVAATHEDEPLFLLLPQRIPGDVDAVRHDAGVLHVGIVGPLRLADGDELDVVLEASVVGPGRVGPRAVQGVDHRRAVAQQRRHARPVGSVVVDDVEVLGPEVGRHRLEHVVLVVAQIGGAERLSDR